MPEIEFLATSEGEYQLREAAVLVGRTRGADVVD
jgi:hypothetical protein